MPSVLFSYSHADESLQDQLEKQLSLLKRQGVIETWHDRRIGAGDELAGTIDARLESSDNILCSSAQTSSCPITAATSR